MNLQEMDAVSFAVKCSDACLTTQQNTFLTQFYPFLAKFVKENIRFVFNLNAGKLHPSSHDTHVADGFQRAREEF